MTFYIIGSGRVGSGRVGSGGHLKASELRALLVPFHSIFTGLRILGIIQKRFIAGDYVYADPSPPMTVKMNQKVTRIEIEIRDNAGKVVSLNDNNTVILMIQRALP